LVRLWQIISLANLKFINSFHFLISFRSKKLTLCFSFALFGSFLRHDGTDVEEVLVLEHHDLEEVLADLPLSLEAVLQLSVEQLREELLQRGIDPKGRPKPQLQLELMQILELQVVVPEVKSTTLQQEQLTLQKNRYSLRCFG